MGQTKGPSVMCQTMWSLCFGIDYAVLMLWNGLNGLYVLGQTKRSLCFGTHFAVFVLWDRLNDLVSNVFAPVLEQTLWKPNRQLPKKPPWTYRHRISMVRIKPDRHANSTIHVPHLWINVRLMWTQVHINYTKTVCLQTKAPPLQSLWSRALG